MLLIFSRISSSVSFAGKINAAKCVRRFTLLNSVLPPNIGRTSTYLWSSTREVHVEISPPNHGTEKLVSLSEGLDQRLARALQADGLTSPTPIQSHAIPLLLKGYDVMASAQTGSGKTLMFSLPLADRLVKGGRNSKSPSAIILNPTRELAMQTAQVLKALTVNTSFKVALATGGANVGEQRRQSQNCDILVGTPGRVLQFVDERVLSLQSTTEVVVDEADRMLDLGFEPQLKRIARALGQQNKDMRRTVLCSATFPPEVQKIASEFLKKDYYFVAAGRVGGVNTGISQKLIWVDGGGPQNRREQVVNEVNTFLRETQGETKRVIVFCNTKDEAERLGVCLKGSAKVVTGDKEQSERNKTLQSFRDGKLQVLVATDVAARGLDVKDVGLVIQADAPKDAVTFVHRVGRTGRAGATGSAICLLDGRSVGIAPDLVELMEEANQEVPTWLLGMSHVARTKTLSEESAIAAGGGSSFGSLSETEQQSFDDDSNDEFIGQDFRKDALTGSWGSERDIAYHSFDEEAYSSLDEFDLPSIFSIDGPAEEDTVETDSPIDHQSGSFLEDFIKSTKSEDASSLSSRRQRVSDDLRDALKQVANSDEIGDVPDRKVLSSLSNKGSDQRLRFEYMGMFPFEEVAELLGTNGGQNYRSHSSDMPRLLMVAEKPSIAEAIAKALSGPNGPRKRQGISKALPVYEFTANASLPGQTEGQSCKEQQCLVTVTSVVGHVFSLGFVEENDEDGNRRRPDPSEYFSMSVVKQEEETTGKLRVVDHLRALAGECDHLVLWLDCDAEGENIAHEVIGVTRRALEQKVAEGQIAYPEAEPIRRIHRARFSAITKEALRDAFGSLVEPDPALSRSVDARQELDLRVGVAMTRLLNWRCIGLARKNFSPATKLVSYGPCQTPALSFCVDRVREIEAFKPKEYWRMHVSTQSCDGSRTAYTPRWKSPKESSVGSNTGRRKHRRGEKGFVQSFEDSASFDEDLVQEVVQLASAKDAVLNIVQVNSVSESMNPPLGLNTVGLLTAGSKAMGMSPKQVMNVAEKLYSGGFISYPRTETTRYDPNGFDVRSVLREHASHPEWGPTASHLLQTKYATSGRPPLRGYDAGDHPPITSLRAATREEVGGGAAWRVYEFVSRNFLGSFGDELEYTRRLAELDIESQTKSNIRSYRQPRFELEQVSIESLGFAEACRWVLRDISAPENKKDEETADEVVFREGMKFSISTAHSEACSTRPPRFLQEHELIEFMDKNRIGTDASMATHVSTIVDREYVVLCDETGVPLRPPRPPRSGQARLPRQIGRYMVPTPLGISLLNLFGKSDDKSFADVDTGIAGKGSPALLARPSIRALMEAEVKQIATGELEKDECLEKNLAWFEARYHQFVASLTRKRLNKFETSLRPTKQSLGHWRRLGVFEPLQQPHQPKGTSQGPRGQNGKGKTSDNKKGQRFSKTGSKARASAPKQKREAK
jgi:DNA topoisomerase-3